MFKLIKYEFRKNLYGMAVMCGIIFAAQLYFMYACFIADNKNKALGGVVVLAYGCNNMLFYGVYNGYSYLQQGIVE